VYRLGPAAELDRELVFIGHFAVGFGSKRVAPRASLGILMAAPLLLDLLWPIFLLLGWESVRIVPGLTAVTPLDLHDYPYSHSLAMSIVWSVLLGVGYLLIARDRQGSIVIGLGVFQPLGPGLRDASPRPPALPRKQHLRRAWPVELPSRDTDRRVLDVRDRRLAVRQRDSTQESSRSLGLVGDGGIAGHLLLRLDIRPSAAKSEDAGNRRSLHLAVRALGVVDRSKSGAEDTQLILTCGSRLVNDRPPNSAEHHE